MYVRAHVVQKPRVWEKNHVGARVGLCACEMNFVGEWMIRLFLDATDCLLCGCLWVS
jgi:hypothetical protein